MPTTEQTEARAVWRQSGGTLSGTQLGDRYGKSPRWGRQQIEAARAEDAASVPAARNGTNGSAAVVPAELPSHDPEVERHEAERAPVPLPFVVVTWLGVLLVAVVAAVASYTHLRHLAETAGMGSLSAWLPLGVDGLALSSTSSLLVDKHRGRPRSGLAVLGLALGIVGSLAGNVVAVDPQLVSMRTVQLWLAAYPPAALAVSGHLLARMVLGDRR